MERNGRAGRVDVVHAIGAPNKGEGLCGEPSMKESRASVEKGLRSRQLASLRPPPMKIIGMVGYIETTRDRRASRAHAKSREEERPTWRSQLPIEVPYLMKMN